MKIGVELTDAELARLDAVRGRARRGAYIREVLGLLLDPPEKKFDCAEDES